MGEPENDGADGSVAAFSAVNVPPAMPATLDDSESRVHKSAPTTPKPAAADVMVDVEPSDQPSGKQLDRSPSGSRRPTPAPTAATDEPPVSHPMTTTTSASSRQESPTQAVGYGTRSRNRGGNRPNYAEDVEMDFEKPQVLDTQSPALSSESVPEVASRESPAPPAVKKQSAASNGWSAMNTNTGSVSASVSGSGIPGTSTFSANPNVTVPHARKRKAAHAQPATNGSSPAQPAQPAQPAPSRRNASAAISTVSTAASRESNLYSFRKSHALLNKAGKLVADDGTTFAKDGMLPPPRDARERP